MRLVFWHLREFCKGSPSLVIQSSSANIFRNSLYSGTFCICKQQSCSLASEATRWSSDF